MRLPWLTMVTPWLRPATPIIIGVPLITLPRSVAVAEGVDPAPTKSNLLTSIPYWLVTVGDGWIVEAVTVVSCSRSSALRWLATRSNPLAVAKSRTTVG